MAPPALVIEFVFGCGWIIPTKDLEPVGVFGFRLLGDDILEGREPGAHMIENSVNNDTQFAAMRFADQFQEQLVRTAPGPGGSREILALHQLRIAGAIGAEVVIHMVKARPVIFVMAESLENRVEINGVDSQAGQVIQLVDQAPQIPAVAALIDSGVKFAPFSAACSSYQSLVHDEIRQAVEVSTSPWVGSFAGSPLRKRSG